MSVVKDYFLAHFRMGALKSSSNDEVQRIIIIHLFATIGLSITGILGIVAGFNGKTTLSLTLLVVSAVYLLARYILAVFSKIRVASDIILYSLYLLMFYLIYSGGQGNTGPLWVFIVAPVSLFLNGLKGGLIGIGCFLLIACSLLFYPNDGLLATSYSMEFKTRLLYSFLTMTFLCSLYEYSRKRSYLAMKDLSQKYERLSKFDPLTGVSNRRDATARLEHEQRRISSESKQLTIMLLDVDHFKAINDEFGHQVGDHVLVELANLLSGSMRKQDLVARWGGEEFLIMLPDTDVKGALNIANKIQHKLAKYGPFYGGQDNKLTVSIGVAEVEPNTDIKIAIHDADKYLYQAKEEGRNRVCFDPQYTA